MASLARCDIVLVPFPFTDLTAQKVRPAVVVSGEIQGEDIVVAFVSSVVPARPGPFDVVLREGEPGFRESGLKRSAVFRMAKLATLSRSLIKRRLGRLPKDLQKRLDRNLARALGLPET